MAFSNITVETSEVVYGKEVTHVHGLTLEIIISLMAQGHRKEMEQAIDTLRQAVGDDLENVGDTANIIGALATTVTQVPELVAKVIAGAADEPESWHIVRKMPMNVQLDAMLKIGKLTFDGEDSIKKFMTDLIELMMAMRKSAVPAVQAVREQLAGMKA